jgi:hemoglobin
MSTDLQSSGYVTRLGGRETLTRLVNLLYEFALGDPILAPVFARVDMDQLRDHQARFLGEVLGGPPGPVVARLRTAHQGLEITPSQFAQMAHHLERALQQVGVDATLASEMLAQIDRHRDDVVGR